MLKPEVICKKFSSLFFAGEQEVQFRSVHENVNNSECSEQSKTEKQEKERLGYNICASTRSYGLQPCLLNVHIIVTFAPKRSILC